MLCWAPQNGRDVSTALMWVGGGPPGGGWRTEVRVAIPKIDSYLAMLRLAGWMNES